MARKSLGKQKLLIIVKSMGTLGNWLFVYKTKSANIYTLIPCENKLYLEKNNSVWKKSQTENITQKNLQHI